MNMSYSIVKEVKNGNFEDLFTSKKSHNLGQCRSKIRLHVLCNLILICTVPKCAPYYTQQPKNAQRFKNTVAQHKVLPFYHMTEIVNWKAEGVYTDQVARINRMMMPHVF